MISVLIPVYNTKNEYLEESINSVLNQTYKNFEIIIIDNGSTNEDTLKKIHEIKKIPNIFIYNKQREFYKKNLSIALNYGITKCNFEYIARLDSDDIMLPERLEKQINYMLNNDDVDILGTQIQNMFGDRHITNHPLFIPADFYKISTHFVNHPSVMFKKSKILSLGGYQEFPDHIPEDYILWTKALKLGLKIHNLSDILVLYRNRENTLSQIDSSRKEWHIAIYETMRN